MLADQPILHGGLVGGQGANVHDPSSGLQPDRYAQRPLRWSSVGCRVFQSEDCRSRLMIFKGSADSGAE